MIPNEITNAEDIIDSRDVIARIEWLEDDDDLTDDERDELAALQALAQEASGSPDWQLIADSYFKTYAMELAEDIGAVSRDAGWPGCHIDWDAAADALKMDYTCVTFGGVDYWIRS